MIIAHPITGLAVTSITKKFLGKLTKKQEKIIWIVGITSAILPDFDLAFAVLTGQSHHHHFITHTPIFYLVIGLVLATILFVIEQINSRTNDKRQTSNVEKKIITRNSKLITKPSKITPKQIAFAEQLIILFLINTVVHILMDIPAGQLHPLWPVYNETISLLNLTSEGNWFATYIKSPAIFLEAFWFIMGLITIWKERKSKVFRMILLTTEFWMLLAVIATALLINYK